MDSSFAMPSFPSLYRQQDGQHQQVPGIHVSADESAFNDLLPAPPSFLPPAQPFEPFFDPSWNLPASGLHVPSAPSSQGSSVASEAEQLFASLIANSAMASSVSAPPPPTSAAPSPSSSEKQFLPDDGVFYVPVEDGHGGHKLAAIAWDDFRGFLSTRPAAESDDLSKMARTIALCKPIQTTFSGVTPPVNGLDLLPSPGSSSPSADGHKLSPSNSGSRKPHRPRIRSLSEQWLRACPVEIEVPTEPLAVWWDYRLGRACVPELGSPATTDDGRWIVFAPGDWYRVFVLTANTTKRMEVFPWSSKEGSNFWIRGQAMGIKECACGEFSFFTQSRPDKDPFKRPSVLRKHFAECPKRPEEHPLKLLSQLQAGANTRARFHRATGSGSGLVPASPATTSGPLVPPFTAASSTTSSVLIAPIVASGLPAPAVFPPAPHP